MNGALDSISKNQRQTVLVVDDEPRNLQLVASVLKQQNYRLLLTDNPADVVDVCVEKQPDLVLLDVKMPVINGYEVARKLKSEERTRQTPIIFLTAANSGEDIEKAFSLGGVDYINKPFKSKELIARVRNQIQINKLTQELVRRNRFKDTLLSVISHDLKSAMFNIDVNLYLLLTKADSLSKDKIIERISRTKNNTATTLELLTQLLEWTRAQFKAILYNPTNFRLSEQIEQVASYMQPQLINKGVTINHQVPDNLLIKGDVNMLQTILRNIISNAIKYSNEGDTIEIIAHSENSFTFISIIDRGVGINAQHLSQLQMGNPDHFTSFGTKGEKGSGLGLSLARDFIKQHGGKLIIDSEVGKGTKFTFTLRNSNRIKG